jgi:hypothetical protein
MSFKSLVKKKKIISNAMEMKSGHCHIKTGL